LGLRPLWRTVGVAEELSYGRAAARLRMPPLSQQIKDLELPRRAVA